MNIITCNERVQVPVGEEFAIANDLDRTHTYHASYMHSSCASWRHQARLRTVVRHANRGMLLLQVRAVLSPVAIFSES